MYLCLQLLDSLAQQNLFHTLDIEQIDSLHGMGPKISRLATWTWKMLSSSKTR